MAMATVLRSVGRKILAGQLPPHGINRAAVAEQRRLLPTAIHGGGLSCYSRPYGTFERCMRAGDLLVRTMTAVGLITFSAYIVTLSVALPVKMIRKRQDKRAQPSICRCHPTVEDKMQELNEILSKYEEQHRSRG